MLVVDSTLSTAGSSSSWRRIGVFRSINRRSRSKYCWYQSRMDTGAEPTSFRINDTATASSGIITSKRSDVRCNNCYCGGGGPAAGAALNLLAAVVVVFSVSFRQAVAQPPLQQNDSNMGTLSNIPPFLSSGESKKSLRTRIQHPKSRKAESCTVKCVNTCIRGGDGEGPLNIRRPLVVFKQGFRSRQYCLVECSDICNLLGDGDDGP